MTSSDTSDETFSAACALIRAGAASDDTALRALIDTRDRAELVGLLLATGALANLLGLLAHDGDRQALDQRLARMLHNRQA
ncbi:hypothetical protein [Streptomyces sp. NPDC056337]|uniref:hypothetical protein n=1 Tax=Streptomyces sp. NPDC056337 TaxID=3345787 RepID=UPI0035DA6AE6